jgi:hypothetical protein
LSKTSTEEDARAVKNLDAKQREAARLFDEKAGYSRLQKTAANRSNCMRMISELFAI